MCQGSLSAAPEVEGLQIYSCPDLLRPGQEFAWHKRGLWIIYLSLSVKQEHALILTIALPALGEGVAVAFKPKAQPRLPRRKLEVRAEDHEGFLQHSQYRGPPSGCFITPGSNNDEVSL